MERSQRKADGETGEYRPNQVQKQQNYFFDISYESIGLSYYNDNQIEIL